MGLWTLHFHTVNTYIWKLKDGNTKYKPITNHYQKYWRNTDTCTHRLFNHHFINTLCTPICCHPQRASSGSIFKEQWPGTFICLFEQLAETVLLPFYLQMWPQKWFIWMQLNHISQLKGLHLLVSPPTGRLYCDRYQTNLYSLGGVREETDWLVMHASKAKQSIRWKFCHISRSVQKTCFCISAL
jgi:hypothetical protein